MNKNNNLDNDFLSPKGEKKRKSNHIIFVFCIFIAAFFWLLIKLSDVYTDTYEFALNYQNTPENQHLSTLMDSSIKVSINASGFKMLKLNLMSDSRKFDIDLNKCDINNLKDDQYYINTSPFIDEIAEDLGIPPEKVELSLQKLTFIMQKLAQKKVGIHNNTILNFAPQFDIYNPIKIEPSQMIIYGPQSIIDTISYIYTENKTIDGINEDIDESLNLINPVPENIHLSLSKTKIKAWVEKFTESSIEIPIDLSNSKYNIKPFPATVKVYFTVALRDFSDIGKSQFKVVPNLEGIDLLKANKLQLKVTDFPKTVSAIRLQPSEIEFLILKQ